MRFFWALTLALCCLSIFNNAEGIARCDNPISIDEIHFIGNDMYLVRDYEFLPFLINDRMTVWEIHNRLEDMKPCKHCSSPYIRYEHPHCPNCGKKDSDPVMG